MESYFHLDKASFRLLSACVQKLTAYSNIAIFRAKILGLFVFELRFFQTANGECLVLETLKCLPRQVQAKAYVRIERLAELGNKLTRPESDYLKNGIYELRWRFVKVQYRLLYFFFGEQIIVLSHIITKDKEVPLKEIEKGIFHKMLFEKNPEKYTYVQEEETAWTKKTP